MAKCLRRARPSEEVSCTPVLGGATLFVVLSAARDLFSCWGQADSSSPIRRQMAPLSFLHETTAGHQRNFHSMNALEMVGRETLLDRGFAPELDDAARTELQHLRVDL